MLRYGISFHAVPRSGRPGEFMVYSGITAWADDECVTSVEIDQRHMTDQPDVHTTVPVEELMAEWADIFYQFAAQTYAKSKKPADEGINAQPTDTTEMLFPKGYTV